MKVQGLQAVQDVAAYKLPIKGLAQESSTAPAQGTGDVYTGGSASLAASIMAGSDLKNISRNELKALTDKLYEAGAITGGQRLDLTIPLDVDQMNEMMHFPVSNPDEKRNYLADLGAVLDAAKLTRPEDTRSIAYLEKVNNLANALAAVSGKA